MMRSLPTWRSRFSNCRRRRPDDGNPVGNREPDTGKGTVLRPHLFPGRERLVHDPARQLAAGAAAAHAADNRREPAPVTELDIVSDDFDPGPRVQRGSI